MISMIALTALGLVRAEGAPAAVETESVVNTPAVVAQAPAPVTTPRFLRKAPDTSTTYDRYGSWQFGLSGGSSTGGGMAVRHWFDDKNGLEIHGYVYLSKRQYPQDQNSFGSSDYGSDGAYFGDDTGTVAQGEISLGVQYLHEVLRIHLFDGAGLFKGGNHLRGLTFVGVGGYADFEDRDLHRGHTEYTYSGYPNYTTTSSWSLGIDQKHTSTQNVLGGAGAGVELELNRFSIHCLIGYGGFYGINSDDYELSPTVDGGLFVRF